MPGSEGERESDDDVRLGRLHVGSSAMLHAVCYSLPRVFPQGRQARGTWIHPSSRRRRCKPRRDKIDALARRTAEMGLVHGMAGCRVPVVFPNPSTPSSYLCIDYSRRYYTVPSTVYTFESGCFSCPPSFHPPRKINPIPGADQASYISFEPNGNISTSVLLSKDRAPDDRVDTGTVCLP